MLWYVTRAGKCWNSGELFTQKNRNQFSDNQTRIEWLNWKLEKICNKVMKRFFQNLFWNWYISGFKVGQKMQNLNGNFFLTNVCGFCREKILSRLMVKTWKLITRLVKKQPLNLVGHLSHQKCKLLKAISRDRNIQCTWSMCHFKEQN